MFKKTVLSVQLQLVYVYEYKYLERKLGVVEQNPGAEPGDGGVKEFQRSDAGDDVNKDAHDDANAADCPF